MNNEVAITTQQIKDMLNEWAHYYRPTKDHGYPKSSAFVNERVQSNRSVDTFIESIPDEILRLNAQIELFAPPFKQLIRLEYFDKRPQKTKAMLLDLTRERYSQRLSFILEQLSFSMFGL